MRFRRIPLIIAFCLISVLACAQAQISASVDKSSVNVNENINLTITVRASGTDIDTPQMPSLPNFNIYSSGQSRSITMLNGKVSVYQQFSYILSPRFSGKSKIGSFKIKAGGKEYATQPIDVEVYRSDAKGGLKPSVRNTGKKNSSGKSKLPDFFMTAKLDKDQAYLNEQLLLKIRFYQAQNQSTFGNPQYDRPKTEGLTPEEIKTAQGIEVIDGKQYVYTEFVTALFGILPGKAAVGPATVQYTQADGADIDTFDLFFNGAASGATLKTVKSDPLSVRIKPLPKENRPKSFYGAVGADYTINAMLDNTRPQVGEPVTLTVTIRGSGNMRAIADIPVPDMGQNFRAYNTASSSSVKITGLTVGGAKTYKTVLVPRATGSFRIPETDFSYFDTVSETYKTISAPPILMEVSPSSVPQGGASVSFAGAQAASSSVEKLNSDINYIKNYPAGYFTLFASFIAGLDGFNYLSLVLIFAAFAIDFINRKRLPRALKKRAFRNAKKAISSAKTLGDVSAALAEYLEAKKGGPIGIMTINGVAEELKITPSSAQSLAKLWGDFDMLKYAPAQMLTNSIAVTEAAERTLDLIKAIEKEIK